MLIPGFLITLITFPGVIVHEIAHRFFCDITRTPVYDVGYFRVRGNPAGYVIHGRPRRIRDALLISVGPLLVNTVLCAALTFGAAYEMWVLDAGLSDPVLFVLAWLGISIGMHAFPSAQDMTSFRERVAEEHDSGLIPTLAKVAAGFFRVANVLRIFWFDAIYALGTAVAVPLLIASAI